MYYEWRPYVSVAQRRKNAAREMQKLRKQGQRVSPVVIEGRTIARTFWGKAWCENLERYSDYENRLPRGRTYVRNGSVVDLQIGAGRADAMVSGSRIYRVAVEVGAVPPDRWASVCADCAGTIDSLVELLQGRFDKGVMERLCQPGTGLFPSPAEVQFSCSCPDWASMCKHVAAVFYGIGARLDACPELLFRLRRVDETELVAKAGAGLSMPKAGPAKARVLPAEGLSEMFGIEMATGDGPSGDGAPPAAAPGTPARAGRGPGKARAGVKASPKAGAKSKAKGGPRKAPAGRGKSGSGARGPAGGSAPGAPGRKAAKGSPRARRGRQDDPPR
jgi:uncharacterized Zn finger protein